MSQVAAVLGTGLEPTASSAIRVVKGMKTLSDLLAKPVRYCETPEQFCLGLHPEFDLERLIALAKPIWVVQRMESSAPENEAPAIRWRRPL